MRASPNFNRLFPEATQPITPSQESGLIKLGQAMRDVQERAGQDTPKIGYTYFGQFVDHDLTQDRTLLNGPYQNPADTRNYRTGYLDLDNVYGGGPTDSGSSRLYEGPVEAATFIIGSTPLGHPRDVHFVDGKPMIPDDGDPRDLENVMVRQIHVLLMKFHNETIRQLTANPPLIIFPDGTQPTGGSFFDQARKLVTWHYQWIVRNKYFEAILKRDIWYKLIDRTLPITRQTDFSIPIEFATAAFRFGHSMVRNSYPLNCKNVDVQLTDLVADPERPMPLADNQIIEWGLFFLGLAASRPSTGSSFIDTSITGALHDMPPISLPVRALLRGARYKIASGQQVFEEFLRANLVTEGDRLSADELTRDVHNVSGTELKNANLQDNTPLFYYILKEAELRENDGRTLGSLGSLIIAQVIETALQSDLESYISVFGTGWRRPSWTRPNRGRGSVESISDIAKLVGDDELLFNCQPIGV